MSLKARTILLTVAVTSGIVITLFLVQLHNVVDSWLNNAAAIGELAGQQTKRLVLLRLEGRNSRVAPGVTWAELKKAWTRDLANDRRLTPLLEAAMAQTRSIIEISIGREDDLVILSSNPARPGRPMEHRTPLAVLQGLG